MNYRQLFAMLPAFAVLAFLPAAARAQAIVAHEDSPAETAIRGAGLPAAPYTRPTQGTIAHNYLFDAFGPYPTVGAALAAGIGQVGNSPPEWNQGAKGYSRRFGSDFAIAATGTTARYGLAEALKEDTLYYRCECRGFFPRLGYAMVSTVTGRHGEDGHRVFSIPAIVAPYAGSATAVYGWYPSRFGAKDAFRIGNYNLLVSMGQNIGLEFIYSGPHSLLSRMHLNNRHGSPVEGPNK